MPYKITQYTKLQAKRLGVDVKVSKVKNKKIDIFKDGNKIASVGALGYMDFPTFLEQEKKGKYPKGYAEQRRKLYQIRHKKDISVIGSNGFWANELLW